MIWHEIKVLDSRHETHAQGVRVGRYIISVFENELDTMYLTKKIELPLRG